MLYTSTVISNPIPFNIAPQCTSIHRWFILVYFIYMLVNFSFRNQVDSGVSVFRGYCRLYARPQPLPLPRRNKRLHVSNAFLTLRQRTLPLAIIQHCKLATFPRPQKMLGDKACNTTGAVESQ